MTNKIISVSIILFILVFSSTLMIAQKTDEWTKHKSNHFSFVNSVKINDKSYENSELIIKSIGDYDSPESIVIDTGTNDIYISVYCGLLSGGTGVWCDHFDVFFLEDDGKTIHSRYRNKGGYRKIERKVIEGTKKELWDSKKKMYYEVIENEWIEYHYNFNEKLYMTSVDDIYEQNKKYSIVLDLDFSIGKFYSYKLD